MTVVTDSITSKTTKVQTELNVNEKAEININENDDLSKELVNTDNSYATDKEMLKRDLESEKRFLQEGLDKLVKDAENSYKKNKALFGGAFFIAIGSFSSIIPMAVNIVNKNITKASVIGSTIATGIILSLLTIQKITKGENKITEIKNKIAEIDSKLNEINNGSTLAQVA